MRHKDCQVPCEDLPAMHPKMDPDQRLAASIGEKMREATRMLTEQGTERTP